MLPASTLGLPASLDYKLPPSLSEDSKAYYVSLSPDGVNLVQATNLPIGSTTQYYSQLNAFNSQQISFTIPSGQSRSVFMDCRETSLTFRLTIQVTTATNAAMTSHNLISSAQSFFDSCTLYSNNIPVEQINGYNILAHQLLTSTVNSAEKFGGCATAMGCDINTQTGVDLPDGFTAQTATAGGGVGTYYYTFSIPLLSVIGLNNPDRMFPIGSVSNLMLMMQTSALLPFVSLNTTALTGAGSMNVTLDQFVLQLKYVDIGMAAASLLYSSLNEGKIFIKTATWVQSSVNIPAGTAGQSNFLYQIRNSSLKSLLIQNSQANVQNAQSQSPNGLYDALNLAVTQFNVSCGGINYPQRPIDPSRQPSTAFLSYMAALGYAGDYKKYGGYITRSGYGASGSNTTTANIPGLDSSMVIVGVVNNCSRAESSLTGLNNIQRIAQFPSTHFLGVDFEKSGGLLFNGVNTRSAPPVANFYMNGAVANASSSIAYGYVDCVLVIDTIAQTIQAFV